MFAQRGYSSFGGLSFGLTPMVKRLLIANGVIFLITLVVGQGLIFDLFALQPDRILSRPWGVVTYMFLHDGFWHLAVNMLVVFFFGVPLEGRWGGREFLKFYAVAGLGGAVLSMVLLPGMVVGASAAVYGLMLAFALNWPNAPIYIYGIFPVKAKWLVAGLFVLTLLEGLTNAGGPIAHAAHLGGLVAAFLYLKADWRPKAMLGRRPGTPVRSARESGSRKVGIVARREAKRATRVRTADVDEPAEKDERRMLDEVDRVLDKISEQGMSSLTSAERKLLDEVSRKRRSN